MSLHSQSRYQRVVELLRKEPDLATAQIRERLPVSENLVARARKQLGLVAPGLAVGCVGLGRHRG